MLGRRPEGPAARRGLGPRARSALAVGLLAAGCVETTPIERVPETFARQSSEPVPPAPEVEPAQGFIGVRAEDNQSDSLEGLTFLPGVRVLEVVESSPAHRAGMQHADVVLAVGGVPVNDKAGFDALVRESRPGATLSLETKRGARLLRLSVEVAASGRRDRSKEAGWVEDLKARVVVRDRVVAIGEDRRAGAEIVRLLPRSPLAEAGLEPGDVVLQLDAADVESAARFVSLIEKRFQLGQRVRCRYVRGGRVAQVPLRLWAPRRVLTGLRIPILFSYERDVRRDRVEWTVIDLFLLSFLRYERRGQERDYRLLSTIGFSTGAGELVEIQEAGEQ